MVVAQGQFSAGAGSHASARVIRSYRENGQVHELEGHYLASDIPAAAGCSVVLLARKDPGIDCLDVSMTGKK